MKLNPAMQTELEATAKFMMERGGPRAPKTIEVARERATLMLEHKYCPLVVQEAYRHVMGVELLSPKPPVPNDAQADKLAKLLALWCDGSYSSLSEMVVAAYCYNQKQTALKLVTQHNASAFRAHSLTVSYGDDEWAANFKAHLTGEEAMDMDAAWASIQP